MKTTTCFFSTVFLICASTYVQAGQNFTGAGDGHLWTDLDNWSMGVVPDDAVTHPSDVVPQWHTDIQMTLDDTHMIIDSTVEAETYSLHVGAFGGENTFEMTGGSLTVGPWALNIGRGGNQLGHEGSFGHMIMTDGVITAPFVIVPEQFVGSGDDQVQRGEVLMSGGEINANWLRIGGKIGEGSVELSGSATINLASHLEMNPDGTGVASLDITDSAVVNIAGGPGEIADYQAFIDEGWLTANGGTGAPSIRHDETTGLIIINSGNATRLQAGDSDQDFDFDQIDLVQVQIAGKYLTGLAATWGEGDWDGAPGGEPGNPPQGNGLFDHLDIVASLTAGLYLTGPYNAVQTGGQVNDDQTSIGYNATTGEVWVDAPVGAELTSINIDSSAGIFTGDPAENLGGSFDNDGNGNIFKATFGSSFGSLSFGKVAQAGLSEAFVANDLTAVGSLAGGGDLGDVDLIYVPEPASLFLLAAGLIFGLAVGRRMRPRH